MHNAQVGAVRPRELSAEAKRIIRAQNALEERIYAMGLLQLEMQLRLINGTLPAEKDTSLPDALYTDSNSPSDTPSKSFFIETAAPVDSVGQQRAGEEEREGRRRGGKRGKGGDRSECECMGEECHTTLQWQDCSVPLHRGRRHPTLFSGQRWLEDEARAAGAVALLSKESSTFISHSLPQQSAAATASGSWPAVVDMGAGLQALSRHLPHGFAYVPVDSEERLQSGPRTLVCDLNRREFPFVRGRVAAFVFLGSFEYMLDKLSLLHLCRKYHAPVMMHYQVGKMKASHKARGVAPLDVHAMFVSAGITRYELTIYLADLTKISERNATKMCTGACYFLFEPSDGASCSAPSRSEQPLQGDTQTNGLSPPAALAELLSAQLLSAFMRTNRLRPPDVLRALAELVSAQNQRNATVGVYDPSWPRPIGLFHEEASSRGLILSQ